MPLRVGTDCSGIDAPIQALINLKVPFVHVFSTDTDVLCGETIRANFCPQSLVVGPHADITTRDVGLMESVDLYVCGFPCQPFSKLGARMGFDDPRGVVFFGCLKYIRYHRPQFVVLENVKTLLTIDESRTWNRIISLLRDIPDYNFSHSVLDTKDFGVPQSRRRLYIVGVRGGSFDFPTPLSTCPDVSDFLDDEIDESIAYEPRGSQFENALSLTSTLEERGSVFVDILQYRTISRIPQRGFTVATCILCTSYVWCVPKKRWATEKELLSLQGFPTDFRVTVPHHKFRKQIGNAMSVNVLEHIFSRLLHLSPPEPLGPYANSS